MCMHVQVPVHAYMYACLHAKNVCTLECLSLHAQVYVHVHMNKKEICMYKYVYEYVSVSM